MTKEELQLVPFDDLWDELCNRFDSCVLAGIQNLDNKHEQAQLYYHGGKFTAIGLCKHMINRILIDMEEEDKQDDETQK